MPDAANDAGTKPLAPSVNSDPSDPFFMSSSDWQKVQCYVVAGIKLPISSDDAVLKLGVAKVDADHMADLWQVYQGVHDHCSTFNTVTYPGTVSLASDVYDYGTHKVPTFYGAITTILDKITAGTLAEDVAETQIGQVLDSLLKDANAYRDKAKKASDDIAAFIQQTQEDDAKLEPLKTRYQAELDGADGRIAQLQTEIEDDKSFIDTYNDEYRKDVTIACTSATYAWVFPAGTIAAAVVAGVYGKRAQEALDHVHEYQDKLEADNKDLAAKVLLSQDLKLAGASIKNIIEALTAALPILEKARGLWSALADDITNIKGTLNNDIKDAPTFIQSLGVQEAIDQWAHVASLANTYRANAFITVVDLKDVKDTLAQDPNAYGLPKAA